MPLHDPDEAALWWATRRQSDRKGFEGDRAAFEAWLAHTENAAAWTRIHRHIEAVGQYAFLPEVREMRRAALDVARQHRPSFRRYWLGSGALAAGLLVALFWRDVSVDPMPRPVAGAEPLPAADAPVRYATGVGERQDVVLPDGSKIALNTDSAIEVRYSAARRAIHLLDGQALFRVAKDRERPFVVAAGDRMITAVGTTFDVRVGPDGGVDVLLVEGQVQVDPARPAGLARWLPALERERLEPGQLLLARPMEAASVGVGDVERVTAWNRGLLIFRNDRIDQAAAEISRYSSTQLVIDDPRIRELRVSGVFPTARPDDFVAALEVFYPIRARRSTGVVALQWREPNGIPPRRASDSDPAVR